MAGITPAHRRHPPPARRRRRDLPRCTDRRGFDDRGSAAITAAVLGVVLLLLPMMLVQAAVYFHAREVAASASRHALESTRVADGTTAAGEAAGREYLDQVDGPLTGTEVDTSRTGTSATATVAGEVTTLVPGLQLTVSVTVSGPVERFEP